MISLKKVNTVNQLLHWFIGSQVWHFSKLCPTKDASWLLLKSAGFLLRAIKGHAFCRTFGAEWPGADVMITIFGDFWQFSAKELALFSKDQCYDQSFEWFSFVLSKKRQVFCRFFQRKHFKNHNIDPRLGKVSPKLLWVIFYNKLHQWQKFGQYSFLQKEIVIKFDKIWLGLHSVRVFLRWQV
jgi:hypothetical protein